MRVFICLFGVVASLVLSGTLARTGSSRSLTDFSVRVTAAPGVSAATTHYVQQVLAREIPVVQSDFPPMPNRAVTVTLYPTHSAFAVAMHREESLWPEAENDDMGNVVAGRWPIGPTLGLLPHRVEHIWTEWLLDRLTGTRGDDDPNPAWLYAGIAEWEAGRHAPPIHCAVHGSFPLPLHDIATAAQWWHVRAGPFSSLEYCEGQIEATKLIRRRGGWSAVRSELAHRPTWKRFAVWMEATS